ncbi:hypothetical protein C9I36_05525 [Pectobacterium punjabense]|nr:hypothetical protein C9I36_05525 [Pectobacterium punjabense]
MLFFYNGSDFYITCIIHVFNSTVIFELALLVNNMITVIIIVIIVFLGGFFICCWFLFPQGLCDVDEFIWK